MFSLFEQSWEIGSRCTYALIFVERDKLYNASVSEVTVQMSD